MENHNFQWENHYKWPFSIAMLNYQRVTGTEKVSKLFAGYCDKTSIVQGGARPAGGTAPHQRGAWGPAGLWMIHGDPCGEAVMMTPSCRPSRLARFNVDNQCWGISVSPILRSLSRSY